MYSVFYLSVVNVTPAVHPSIIPNHEKGSKGDVERIMCTSEPAYLYRGIVMMVLAWLECPLPTFAHMQCVFPPSRRQEFYSVL